VSLSSIPRSVRASVYERDGGQCQYCHLKQLGQGATFHINHVVPRSKGGTMDPTNLVLQCPHCSHRKADKTEAADPVSGEATVLFHPLSSRWEEYFSTDATGLCVGRTATGRATVQALQMNDPVPRTARAIQLLLGII
jgi:hypothetical protein